MKIHRFQLPVWAGLVIFLLLWSPVDGMEVAASLEDIAQTADLIFVGTVESIACRPDEEKPMLFTDIEFRDIEVIHGTKRSVQRDGPTIRLTYAGGSFEDRAIRFSGAPRLEEGRRYLVFVLDDGKRYLSPLVGGSQGIFEVIHDSEISAEYLLTHDGRLISAVDPDGVGVFPGAVSSVENGRPIYSDPMKGTHEGIHAEELPEPVSKDDGVAVGGKVGPADAARQPLPLRDFIRYIKDEALQRPIPESSLRRGGQGGKLFLEKDGVIEEFSLSGRSKRFTTPVSDTGPEDFALKGDSLFACGAQDLKIVMEQVPESWWEWHVNSDSMWLWNEFMYLYQYVADDGSWGRNSENEFGGYPSDAELNSQWGGHWGTSLAVTPIEIGVCSGECCKIYESDVLLNPAYSFTDSESLALGNGSVLLLKPVIMHEVGHTWGHMVYQDGGQEQYNYDHLSVMHAYYSSLVENGKGIHAADAYLVRRQYDDQTGVPSIRDIGVESYYASNGLKKSTTDASEYYPNDSITVTNLTVENNSNSTVSDLRIRLFLSTNRIISTADYRVGEYWSWSTFSKESHSVFSLTSTVPAIIPPGDYLVGAMVTRDGYSGDDYSPNNATSLFDAVRIYPGKTAGVFASDRDYDYRVRVSWEPVVGATAYNVFRKSCPSCSESLFASTTATVVDDNNGSTVDPECTYYYATRADSAVGVGRMSVFDAGTRRFAIPTDLSATDGISNRVHLTWNAVSGATGYAVWRSDSPGDRGSRLATVSGATFLDDFSGELGRRYDYRVAAANSCGEGEESSPVSGYRGDLVEIFRDGFESAYSDRWSATRPTTWYADCDQDGFAFNAFQSIQTDVPTEPPSGCSNGAWTKVAPASSATRDCNDSIADAFPGQTEFFSYGYFPNQFDYDCDGNDDEEYTVLSPEPGSPLAGCAISWVSCRPRGWTGWDGSSVPVCGQRADYLSCGWVTVGHLRTCSQIRTSKMQACR